jgi:hypothetical protein
MVAIFAVGSIATDLTDDAAASNFSDNPPFACLGSA